jgi:hypothetical protein
MDVVKLHAALKRRYKDGYSDFVKRLDVLQKKEDGCEFGSDRYFDCIRAAALYMSDGPLSLETLPELAQHVKDSIENVSTLGVRLLRFKESMHQYSFEEAYEILAKYGKWVSNPLVPAFSMQGRITSMRALFRPEKSASMILPPGPLRGTVPTWYHPAPIPSISIEDVLEIHQWLLHPFVWRLMKENNLDLALAIIE